MLSVTRSATLVFFAIAFLAIAPSLYGQGSNNTTGNGGIHVVRGRIFLPNGRTLDRSIKVELQSSSHPSQSVYTDNSGAFAFSSLSPGSYTVVVDAGDPFEVAREYFFIDKEAQSRVRIAPVPKIQNAPIYLRLKPSEVLKNEVLNAKLAMVPSGAIQRYERGLELAAAGKDEEAIKTFTEALGIYPRFSLPHVAIGKIYIRAGKLDEAVTALRSATSIDPSEFDAHLNLGIAFLGKRSLDDAEIAFTQAISLDQAAVTPHYYLGLVMIQRADLDGAVQKFEYAKELTGINDFPLIHKYLGGIYWQKAGSVSNEKERLVLYKLAADELEKYVKLMPTANDAKKIKATISELRTKLG